MISSVIGVINTVCSNNNNIVYWITRSIKDVLFFLIRHDDDVNLAVPIEFIDKLKQGITKYK